MSIDLRATYQIVLHDPRQKTHDETPNQICVAVGKGLVSAAWITLGTNERPSDLRLRSAMWCWKREAVPERHLTHRHLLTVTNSNRVIVAIDS